MKVFIDGMIFGRQRFGGISKVWEAYLSRLCTYDLDIELLVPFRKQNPSLKNVLTQQQGYEIRNDFLYWPVRIFERAPVRSNLLQWFHVDRDVDIFHSTFLSTIYSKKVKKVVTVHDLIPELFEAKQPNKWTAMTLDIRRRVFENADHLIAISRNTRDDLLRLYPKISPEQVSLIYNGITPGDSLQDAGVSLDEVNRNYKLHLARQRYYLYVGNRRRYKNFKLILEWLNTYDHRRDVHFVCVGGEDTMQFKQRLTARGMADIFTLLPFVSDAELAALYRHALALVYPSKYEGFGLPVLEAMIYGCPVLCSGTSSLPEVGGDAALYFDPDSPASLDAALRQFATVPHEVLLARSRENAARFSWEQSTQQLVEVYERLG